MKTLQAVRLSTLKKEAKLLHKSIKNDYSIAVKRYMNLPHFSNLLPNEIKLKHAFQVIAIEYGYDNWNDLRSDIIERDMLFRKNGVGLVHKWFKQYNKALLYHQRNGGYLLRFWNDYVICGHEYIELINLSDYQNEWKVIGYNWIEPKSGVAFKRLRKAAERAYLSL